ncbi:MAG: hypothetical protein DRI65_17115 [Chloroflexota bacterium]|nr:MAG: hypothetical protein DRI65_17115 [Chloroflexota bacterium]
MRLTEYFFKSLPDYFFTYDSYKRNDILGFEDREYGLLERYMKAFQEDAEISDGQITGLNNLPFPLTTEDQYLSYIAGFYGYPPDTFGDLDYYRALLRNITDINKVKGTEEGYIRFFKIMGINVSIDIVSTLISYYDNGNNYDAAPPIYYDTVCYPCSYLTISVDSFDDPVSDLALLLTSPPYSEDTKRSIQSILMYLSPINTIIDEVSGLDGWVVTAGQDIQMTSEQNLMKFKRII